VAIHDGLAVISIDQVIGSPRSPGELGWQRTVPRHVGRQGVLAFMPRRVGRDPRGDLEAFTRHRRRPREAVDGAGADRLRGYAITLEEHEIGLPRWRPLRDMDGEVVAA